MRRLLGGSGGSMVVFVVDVRRLSWKDELGD